MISLTIFDSIYKNQTNNRMDFESFAGLEKMLYALAKNGKYRAKSDAPLISPATYKEGTTRANDNVERWTFAIVDVDSYEGSMEDISKEYDQYRYVCYSTASSTVEKSKFRLVFPLTRHVEREEIPHFWLALNREIGEIGDVQTKDLSRMFYVPSQYDNANNFIFTHEGEVMDPTDLMSRHKYVEKAATFFDTVPAAIQAEMLQHRRGKMNNLDFKWTSYKNCPFVKRQHINDYMSINDTGWYHASYGIMVSIAGVACAKGYPITAVEIEQLLREMDNDTGGWYAKRPIAREAQRAIDFVFKANF